MATRLGIDVGGTFTDMIFFDNETKKIIATKVPTNHSDIAKGCMDAILQAVPTDKLKDTEYFLYGTTVGINALIERKGPQVGLLGTKGFRDILELRSGSRLDIYDLFWRPQKSLVPRQFRISVSERMQASGKVYIPLCKEDVLEAYDFFEEQGVNSIAIAFLHAYANPIHELAAAEILRIAGFRGGISMSHQISGEYREYPRTMTTVIDAFVKDRISENLDNIEKKLSKAGFGGELLITRSGGGSMTFAEAKERTFETIMSGPAAGAEGAGELARTLNLGDLIAADIGGTSFDTCVIHNGRAPLLQQGEVTEFPILAPWVDVRCIGSGGGSIAWIDQGDLLQVGPKSAGSIPGPACYGRGGTEPTITDAALVLGMFGDGKLTQNLQLDMQKARVALKSVADELNLSVADTARGILRIATILMATAIREITVERGLDPREMALLMFGGFGPLMGSQLAEELEMTEIIIPPYAGNFSAWSLLGADLVRAKSITRILPLTDAALRETSREFDALFSELIARNVDDAYTNEFTREAVIDVRYKGQEHTLSLPLETKGSTINRSASDMHHQFTKKYHQIFGSTLGDRQAEIVALRATLRKPLPRRSISEVSKVNSSVSRGLFDTYSFTTKKVESFQIIERSTVAINELLAGPAIIKEATTTTYVDVGFEARLDSSGCFFITNKEIN